MAPAQHSGHFFADVRAGGRFFASARVGDFCGFVFLVRIFLVNLSVQNFINFFWLIIKLNINLT